MSNDEYQLNEELLQLLEEFSILLLTKQKIRLEMVDELNVQLINLSKHFENASLIPKNIASELFEFYLKAHTEASYRDSKDRTAISFLGNLQSNISKIFGAID